jgi:hypothetical protein
LRRDHKRYYSYQGALFLFRRLGTMSEAGFTITGMDDFRNNLSEVLESYTDTSEKHLKKIGNKLKKEAKENSPESPYDHKKKLKKSWKSKVEGLDGKDLE